LYVGKTSDGATWEVEKQTMERSASGEINFWLRKRPGPKNPVRLPTITGYSFRCSSREYREASSLSGRYSIIPPGTMMENVLQTVCPGEKISLGPDRWLFVGKTSRGTTWDVDKQTMERSASGEINFWLRKRPDPKNRMELFSVSNYTFRCSSREYRRTSSGSDNFSRVPPGTLVETAAEKVCDAAQQLKLAKRESRAEPSRRRPSRVSVAARSLLETSDSDEREIPSDRRDQNSASYDDATRESHRDHFTVGSTKDEVLSVQGTPTSFNDYVFRYGLSKVHFRNGRVVSWEDYGDLKVRAYKVE
jgi:hypothetical protein